MKYLFRTQAIPQAVKDRVAEMYIQRFNYKQIGEETGIGEKRIRQIVRARNLSREPAVKREVNRDNIQPPVLASEDGRIFMIGYVTYPEWCVPYIEARRVYNRVVS